MSLPHAGHQVHACDNEEDNTASKLVNTTDFLNIGYQYKKRRLAYIGV